MARSNRGGRRARRPNAINQPGVSLPQTTKRATRSGGRRATNRAATRGTAYAAYFEKGNDLIATMKQWGISGIEKVQQVLGETAAQLVGPSSFSGTTVTNTPRATRASTPTRRTGIRRGNTGITKISKAQQMVLNSFGIGEQLTATAVAQRTGMQKAACVRAMTSLGKKAFLGSSGRGNNKVFWKQQQPQQQAA